MASETCKICAHQKVCRIHFETRTHFKTTNLKLEEYLGDQGMFFSDPPGQLMEAVMKGLEEAYPTLCKQFLQV